MTAQLGPDRSMELLEESQDHGHDEARRQLENWLGSEHAVCGQCS